MQRLNYGGKPGPGPIYTQEFKEVLASTELQAKLPGGVLLAQGNGVVAKGTVLGKVTATGKYKPYSSSAVDGSQSAVCILDNDKDTTDEDIGASAWIAGIFDTSKLTGLDAAAKTALKLCYFV
ncbi:head decoration protein [Paenibacillus radicis (ex Xue et al. 2023)]|uniref:Head decoration protein n=1 Tax=Paenibacillus radicis (ex Xue et al. 2023) TaxID=2972489 RepID=A0ABT1YL86_9BACL|nr:head decoration protein [Paenibacillus radicis (ex Xue et al. 2023)]MCR8633485.1 head decoration protein [Paenibacillus radicis (ex Xue et al. 2023)]